MEIGLLRHVRACWIGVLKFQDDLIGFLYSPASARSCTLWEGGSREIREYRHQKSPLPVASPETESAGGNFEGERSQLGEAMQGQERGERS